MQTSECVLVKFLTMCLQSHVINVPCHQALTCVAKVDRCTSVCIHACTKSEYQKIDTRAGSLMLPRPLIRTRHSVLASTRLREFPLGPRRRPTKLNYTNNEAKYSWENAFCLNNKLTPNLSKMIVTYSRVFVHRYIDPDGFLDNEIWRTTLRPKPTMCWWRLQ